MSKAERIATLSKEEQQQALLEKAKSTVYGGQIAGASLPAIVDAMKRARAAGLPDKSQGYLPDATERSSRTWQRPSPGVLERKSARMLRDFGDKKKDTEWVARLKDRLKLPVMANKLHRKLIEILQESDVVIIPGNTGSGKSTQVPQIILDYAIQAGHGAFTNILCTQPRRISATSVARRVAYERKEDLGFSVGSHVRFAPNLPQRDGYILYCTAGILWQYLQHNPDSVMDGNSHVIIDEVHERSDDVDLVMMTLRELIHQRKAVKRRYPKLLLMSATIKTQDYVTYFSQSTPLGSGLRTQVLEVPGQLFPITDHYLEDVEPVLRRDSDLSVLMTAGETKEYLEQEQRFAEGSPKETPEAEIVDDDDELGPELVPPEPVNLDSIVPHTLAAAYVIHVLKTTSSGDILVFLPGLYDLDKTAEYLEHHQSLQRSARGTGIKIFKLHSALAETNDDVFEDIPKGWRRIVLATDIAETSVTLPDVEHVIDSGTCKDQRRDDVTGNFALECMWTNKQSQRQRKGRAGRVRAGNYYALFSKARYESMDDTRQPDLLHADLTGMALELKAKINPMNIKSAFSKVLDPPPESEVDDAIHKLKNLGALTQDESVTPLGRAMSHMMGEPSMSKAVLLGLLFRCLEPMLLAASFTNGESLVEKPSGSSSPDLLKNRYEFAAGSDSGSIASINAFKALNKAYRDDDDGRVQYLIAEKGLKQSLYASVARNAKQICQQLVSNGLIPEYEMGEDLYPNIPNELNIHAENVPLIKFLLLLSLHPELAARHSRYTFLSGSWLSMPAAKSVNYSVSASLQRRGEGGRVPTKGDLLSYMHGRVVQPGGRVAMVSSNMITPLTAILAADKVALGVDDQKIGLKLDDTINMTLTTTPSSSKVPVATSAVLLREYRKMIERFLQTAFSDIRVRQHTNVDDTTTDVDVGNTMFLQSEHKVRDTFICGLIKVLRADEEAEKALLAQRFEEWCVQDQIKREAMEKKRASIDSARGKKRKTTASDEVDQNGQGENADGPEIQRWSMLGDRKTAATPSSTSLDVRSIC